MRRILEVRRTFVAAPGRVWYTEGQRRNCQDSTKERCKVPKLLEKVFVEVSQLPEEEQDEFAAWMLEELASEQAWRKAFADSENALAQLAEEAIAEHRANRTQALDPDSL